MDLDEAARLRKEKMSQLKKNFDSGNTFREGLTSAPSVVHVDEFHDELSMAERRKREEAERQRLNTMPNKQRFFMNFNKKASDQSNSNGHEPSDLHNNILVEESTRRSRDHHAQSKIDQEIDSIFADDPEYSMTGISTISKKVSDKINENEMLDGGRLVQEADRRKGVERFQPNQYHGNTEAQRVFQVGASSENLGRASLLEQNRRNSMQNMRYDKPDLKSSQGPSKDSFSDDSYQVTVSMPAFNNEANSSSKQFNPSTKDDPLSQSQEDWKLRHTNSVTNNSKSKNWNDKSSKLYDSDTEADYFQKMEAQNNKVNTSKASNGHSSEQRNGFRDFINNSFNKAESTNVDKNPKVGNAFLNGSQKSTVSTSNIKLEGSWKKPINRSSNVPRPDDEDEMEDCIDLKADDRKRKNFRRPASPDTFSVQTSVTEFSDPDRRGRARTLQRPTPQQQSRNFTERSRNLLSSSFGGLLVLIPGFSNRASSNNISTVSMDSSGKFDDDDDYEDGGCSSCDKNRKRHRRPPWCTVFVLLAIDAFTIALLLILFYNCNQVGGPPPYPFANDAGLDSPRYDKQTSNGKNFADENRKPYLGTRTEVDAPSISINQPPDHRGREFGARGLNVGTDFSNGSEFDVITHKPIGSTRKPESTTTQATSLSDPGQPSDLMPEFSESSNSTRRDERNIILTRTVEVQGKDSPSKERIGPENRIGPVGTANPFQPTAESTARSYNIDDGFLNVKTSPAANEGEPFYTFQTLPLPKLESLTIPTTTTDSSPSTSTLTSSTLSSFSATTSEVKTASSTPEVVPKLVQQLVTDLEGVRQRVENGNGLLTEMNQLVVNLTNEVQRLHQELNAISRPPAFACHRTEPFTHEGVITFNSCNVNTDGMNPSTGIFTVKTPGIYQLSFTGLFHVSNGHQIDADIIRQTPDGRFSNLGRSSADTNEIATFFVPGTDDDLMITATMMTMSHLNVDDLIYVETHLSEGHGHSVIRSSSSDPGIHFVGQRISL